MHIASIDNPVYRFRTTRFWAEEGSIVIVNETTGQVDYDPPVVGMQKAAHAGKIAKNMRRGEKGNYQSEKREMQKLARDMYACAMAAHQQGPAMREDVRAEAEHYERRYQEAKRNPSKSLLVTQKKPLFFLPQADDNKPGPSLLLPPGV